MESAQMVNASAENLLLWQEVYCQSMLLNWQEHTGILRLFIGKDLDEKRGDKNKSMKSKERKNYIR